MGNGHKGQSIRATLRALEPRGVTERIPERVRRRVVDYVAGERRGGRSWADLGEVLGLSPTTLKRWTDRELGVDGRALVPVAVVGDDQSDGARDGEESKLVVVTAGGLRVEGLDLKQTIELVRAVG